MTESQDDLASRGRAIFQRLRGSGRRPRSRRAPADGGRRRAAAEAPALSRRPTLRGRSPTRRRRRERPAAGRAARPAGPLPGREDLPALDDLRRRGRGGADRRPSRRRPIYVPPEDGRRRRPPEPARRRGAGRGRAPSPFARPLPRVLAVANQKGGVGKTTTAVNLGACLADLGYRVLVVDLDPQGNASTGLGINIRDLHGSMYDVILHDLPIEDCVEATVGAQPVRAPRPASTWPAPRSSWCPAFSRELRLQAGARARCATTTTSCSSTARRRSACSPSTAWPRPPRSLVPIQCEYYALEGLGQLLRNVNLVQKNLNPALEVSAIVLVMYDARTKLADQVVEEVREHFGAKVCRNVVPRTVRLSEAPSFGQPIIAFDPSSRGAIAYRELAKEVSGGTPQRAG